MPSWLSRGTLGRDLMCKNVALVGAHRFSRREPAAPPFAWQSSKAILFYFTPAPSPKKELTLESGQV